MKNFYGVITPIVTCFNQEDNFSIDENGQRKLINYLFDKQNIDGIAACASAGEGVLLSDEEYWEVAHICLEESKKRKKLAILTTTHFNPNVTIQRNLRAKELDFDAVLLTPPPYSKPDQRGIKTYFQEIAKQSKSMPIILYNIWYRTGGNSMESKTIIELAKHENIIGIKDCGVSIDHIDEVIEKTDRKSFIYFCGEDSLYFDYLMHGANGAISASSHILGKIMKEMLEAKQDSRIEECLSLHRRIKAIIHTLFAEPSPTVIKTALAYLGVCNSIPKYPVMLPASDATKEIIYQQLSAMDISK